MRPTVTIKYDGSFDGLLTSIFERYNQKLIVENILNTDMPLPLFHGDIIEISSDDAKATRVWRGIKRIFSPTGLKLLTQSFLSEEDGIDFAIFKIITGSFDGKRSIENDFSNTDVTEAWAAARRVGQERHRMLQFLRFQKAADGSYFAPVEPRYDVLPMAVGHFADRFADQRFLIYDIRRQYGYFYNGESPIRITFNDDRPHLHSGRLSPDLLDEQERLFQSLWRTYFNAIAITERSNPRKQRQDMPVRYWKHLTELQNPL